MNDRLILCTETLYWARTQSILDASQSHEYDLFFLSSTKWMAFNTSKNTGLLLKFQPNNLHLYMASGSILWWKGSKDFIYSFASYI